MKLRLKHNTLRIRITQSEVSRLMETGHVEETIRFNAGAKATFTYAILIESGIASMRVRYEPASIVLRVPVAEAQNWANSNAVGIYASVDVGSEGVLELTLEKDFACLDGTDTDNLDAFPNPQAGAEC